MTAAPADIEGVLRKLGLPPRGPLAPLTGGVSCEVFRLDAEGGPYCVKRALAQLRVAADWRAPLERSHSEVRWLQAVADIEGVLAPRVIAEDQAAHLFVMSWFDPATHPVWKAELAAGRVDLAVAHEVGDALGRIHATSARRPDLAAAFRTGDLFHALRLEPYLLHTARAHPDLAGKIETLAAETLAREIALVHGDVSPKNLLIGPGGPVFLDAECAWWGDPAFDLAFCLNHLLLKTVWRPDSAAALITAFETLRSAYAERVDWEPLEALETRATRLLAALLLARIDGKSPVEYLQSDRDRAFVRDAARSYLQTPPERLASLAADWAERIKTR